MRDTTAVARKTSSLTALSKNADGSVCVRKKCRGGHDGTASSNKGKCCISEKTTGYSVLKEDGCYGTEEQGKCSGTRGGSGCPVESKAGLCSAEKELGYAGTKNGNRIIADQKPPYCSVTGKHDCGGSAEKDESYDPKKKAGSSEKPKKCCCQLAACSYKSYCSEADKGTSGFKATGTCCVSGSSDLDECSKDVCCNGSSSRSGEEVFTPEKSNERAADHLDIEKGAIFLEHVVLDVQGLTCIGCETQAQHQDRFLFLIAFSTYPFPSVCSRRVFNDASACLFAFLATPSPQNLLGLFSIHRRSSFCEYFFEGLRVA